MGYGEYSHDAHEAILRGRAHLPSQGVFKQKACHALMNPRGVRVRESRDSAEHPNSLGVVFALDVTGSMGEIPTLLAKEQLPKFMRVLTDCQIPDPQILFMAVGDATCDAAPLQVGQFETTAELMDQWLTWSYLERGGGSGNKESYELALYFLAQHIEMDCWVKRQRRGYLFMTGDELPYPDVSKHVVESVIGDKLDDDLKVEEVIAELQTTFVPFFIIPDRERRSRCEDRWRQLLGDHVICMDAPSDVCFVTAGSMLVSEGSAQDLKALSERLRRAGMPENREAAVLRALRPFAEATWRGRARSTGSAVPPAAGLKKLVRGLFGET